MGKHNVDSSSSAAAAGAMGGPRPSSSLSSMIKGSSFKGVRRRSWGTWVSEIRMPHSRERIWLGSFASPVQAARAFDAAAICLRRGLSSSSLNLPHLPTPRPLLDHSIFDGSSTSLHPPVLSKKDIQSIAAAAAADIDASEYAHVDPPSVLNTHVIPADQTSAIVQQTSWIFHPDCPSQLQLEVPPYQPLPDLNALQSTPSATSASAASGA